MNDLQGPLLWQEAGRWSTKNTVYMMHVTCGYNNAMQWGWVLLCSVDGELIGNITTTKAMGFLFHFSDASQSLSLMFVQSLSCVLLFVIPWTVTHQAPLSPTIFQSSFKFMSIESVMLSNHLILCRILLLPSIFPSIRVFSNKLVLFIRGIKVLKLQFWQQSFWWIFRVDFL